MSLFVIPPTRAPIILILVPSILIFSSNPLIASMEPWTSHLMIKLSVLSAFSFLNKSVKDAALPTPFSSLYLFWSRTSYISLSFL